MIRKAERKAAFEVCWACFFSKRVGALWLKRVYSTNSSYPTDDFVCFDLPDFQRERNPPKQQKWRTHPEGVPVTNESKFNSQSWAPPTASPWRIKYKVFTLHVVLDGKNGRQGKNNLLTKWGCSICICINIPWINHPFPRILVRNIDLQNPNINLYLSLFLWRVIHPRYTQCLGGRNLLGIFLVWLGGPTKSKGRKGNNFLRWEGTSPMQPPPGGLIKGQWWLIHSLKLTARTWKWMVGRRSFPFWDDFIFRGEPLVSGRLIH